MTTEEIKEYVRNCPYADKSIDTIHTCDLEFHYRKICPSAKCLCAERFGIKKDMIMEDALNAESD